jgi:serine/threonine protein kinase
MRCPHCNYTGEWIEGRCPRCGYGSTHLPQAPLASLSLSPSTFFPANGLLRQGRYHLMGTVDLPENQKSQATARVATDTQSQRLVVIRAILPSNAGQGLEAQEIRQAATRLAELSTRHPGIPAILDLFQERGNFYLVESLVTGMSLAALLQQEGGALPERVLAEYGRQLCAVLTVLASQHPPVIHGAISPSTLVVSPDGTTIALNHLPLFPPSVVPSGKLSGSSGYLAPEQARGVLAPSVDLYALAATLYHALTGSDPAERVAFFAPPVRRLNSAVTTMMEAILARELRLAPHTRYSTPAAMQADLEALIASYPDTDLEFVARSNEPLRTLSSEQMRERFRSNSLLDMGVVAAIFALVLIALLFYLLLR